MKADNYYNLKKDNLLICDNSDIEIQKCKSCGRYYLYDTELLTLYLGFYPIESILLTDKVLIKCKFCQKDLILEDIDNSERAKVFNSELGEYITYDLFIDCSDIMTMEELHIVLADKLNFPDFYGHNWNSFWDAITGLVNMPNRIFFISYSSMKEKMKGDLRIMEKCFTDMIKKYPDIKCEVYYE